ncbi:Uncharacterized protein FWK35_00002226 [Aphis craccivora]|uniref:Uncharacterized protein n=1 Tax=Aphis craccivora TaxID=307492 RepID=A0A6G0ZS97_APHCR|nr:Uncharacterized protein FWK35_00002226 [Aphis craccivora]
MAAKFTMIMICLSVLNVTLAMPAAQPAGVENENMKTAETSHIHLPFSFGFGAYPARYAPFGFRSGLGISVGYPNVYTHGYGYSNDYPYLLK